MRRLLYILLFILCAGVLLQAVGAKKTRSTCVNEVDTILYNYLYMEAERQNVLGNYDAALALMKEAHHVNPTALSAQYCLSMLYIRLQMPDAAINFMQRAAEGDTTHFWYNMTYATSMVQLQQYDKAEEVFKRIIRNHPQRPEVYESLAIAYIYQDEYDKALACYDSIETYMGNSPELTSYRVNLYDAKGDTAAAINIAEELVQNNPTNIYYAIYLSSVYSHYHCDSLRRALLDKVIAIDPEEPMLQIEQADYFLSQGDTLGFHREYAHVWDNMNIEYRDKYKIFENYIHQISYFAGDTSFFEAYRRMVELYPYESQLRKDYASILIYYERWDEAHEQVRTIAMQTDSCADWEQLLKVSLRPGRSADALEAGHKVIERGGDNGNTYMYISNALAIDERYDEAEMYIHKGLERCNEQNHAEKAVFYTLLGDIYSARDILDKCYQYYDSAMIYAPDNAWMLNNYAYKLAENGGDLLKAETMSVKAMKISPDNPTYIDTYAWIMFKMESYFIARVYMEQAIAKLDVNATDVAIYYEHYGDILAMSGDVDGAVEQWLKAQEAGGDSTILRKKIELKQYIEDETNSTDNSSDTTGVGNGM